MSAFWHPLSALFIEEPRSYATVGLLRMLLPIGTLRLIYRGDRMWPAIRDGQRVEIGRHPPAGSPLGRVVLVAPGGVPDLLRVVGVEGERLRLAGDADPAAPRTGESGEILGWADLPVAAAPARRRRRRRRWLDWREAWSQASDPVDDEARTVRDKYDAQAPFYAQIEDEALSPALADAVTARVAPGGRILVLGSGSGREVFALERKGFRADGVDFSEEMVRIATSAAAEGGRAARFERADLRELQRARASLDALLFTYDVYSFIPGRACRIDTLARMADWLRPGGTVFLSARIDPRARVRWLLRLQRWRHPRRIRERGDSHTRWIGMDGGLWRSYVHVFGRGELEAEIAGAGLATRERIEGHLRLTRPAATMERPTEDR